MNAKTDPSKGHAMTVGVDEHHTMSRDPIEVSIKDKSLYIDT